MSKLNCVKCHSFLKELVFCNSCYQESKEKSNKEGAKQELEIIKDTMFGNPKPYASYEHCWKVLQERIEKRLKELEGVNKK
jgi:hypothetical protein